MVILENVNPASVKQSRKTGLRIWREYENMIETEAKSQKEKKPQAWFLNGGAHLIQGSCAVTMRWRERSSQESCKNFPAKGATQ
jgi:hypothetical protein